MLWEEYDALGSEYLELGGKVPHCQCRRWRFDLWVEKISPGVGNGKVLQYSYRVQWAEEPGRAIAPGVQRVRRD